jgi:hypothetical protein
MNMDKQEATALIRNELGTLRVRSYDELTKLVDTPLPTTTATGPSGTSYQIELQVHWDDRPGGAIRVIGSIDDSGWRAFVPLTQDFIVAPDNSIAATW